MATCAHDLLIVVSCHVLLHVALDEAVKPVALAHVAHELHRRRLHHRRCPDQEKHIGKIIQCSEPFTDLIIIIELLLDPYFNI